jgi:hypothetical protein
MKSRWTPVLDKLGVCAQIAAICAGRADADADKAITAAIANRILRERGLPVSEAFQAAWTKLSGCAELATAIYNVLKPIKGVEAAVVQNGLVGALDGWPLDFAGSTGKPAGGNEAGSAANAQAKADGASSPLVSFTKLSNLKENPLSKTYTLQADGTLSKPHAPNISECMATVVKAPLHSLYDGLTAKDCLVFGIPNAPMPMKPGESIKILPEKYLDAFPGCVARTQDYFRHAIKQPGVMLLDFDADADCFPQTPSRKPAKAHADLLALCPGLADAAVFGAPSASSGVVTRTVDGNILREKHGSHLHFIAEDASDIPRAGAAAFGRMILAGLGGIKVAKNGALLVRGMFDGSVFGSERVSYTAGASYGPGIAVTDRGETLLVPGVMVDTRKVFIDLTPAETKIRDGEIRRLKAAVPGDRVKKQREGFEEEAVERMTKRSASREQAREYVKTMHPGYRGSLGAGVVLVFDDFGEVTVAEVLSDPAKYHLATLADPIEGIEYGRGKAKVFVRDDGSIIIHSFAHGGQVFTLRNKDEGEKAKADKMPPGLREIILENAIDAPLRAEASRLIDRKKVDAKNQKARKKWLRRVEVYVALGVLDMVKYATARETIMQIAAVGPGEIKPGTHALELGRRAIDLILSRGIGLDAAEEEAKKAGEKKSAPSGMGEEEAEILAKAPPAWETDEDGKAIPGVSSNLAHFLAYHLGLYVEYDKFKESVAFKRLFQSDQVGDDMLDRWKADFEAAVRDIYRITTDTMMPWGPSGYSPKKYDVQDWTLSLADERSFNSATDRLMAWEHWDNVKRLHDWGARYFGYNDKDPEHDYVRHACAHILRGFVGGILRPGIQFDEMLVLLGLQGERKTSLVRLLGTTIVADGYLEGAHLNFDESAGHNRIAIATTGKVIVEMAELKGLYKRDVEDQKRIISRTSDTGRAMYGKTIYTKQRQWVMVGTANCVTMEDADEVLAELAGLALEKRRERKREIMAGADLGFLVDESGNRRYLPVAVMADVIDLDGLAKELPQLIAEAKAEVIERNFCLKMDVELEKLAGQHAGKFRATGDLGERIASALAKFEGKDVNFTRQDMIKVLDIKTETDKTKMGAALRRADFKSYVGNHGLTRFYRGDKDKATRLTLTEFGTARFKEENAAGEVGAGATKEPEGSFNPGGNPSADDSFWGSSASEDAPATPPEAAEWAARQGGAKL